MKTLLYSKNSNIISKSGIGEAIRHQEKMLKGLSMDYTKDSKEDYDIIHINTIFPDSLRMSKQAKKENKKVVYYAHSTMEDFRNSFIGSNLLAPLFKKWISTCYNSADLIITPTEYSKKLLETYGLNPPIYNLSNGVDTKFFKEDALAGKIFRDRYNIKKEEKVIISVGHFIERKGILDFIKVARDLPQYKFYWFGHTNLKIIPKKVRQAIESHPANLYFPGYISPEELRQVYCGGDLFLFMTHEETEGIVLLEALASKIPILLRDIPIYSTWLEDGADVYKARGIEEFKIKIKNILNGELPDLRQNAHKIALKHDLKVVGEELLEIYKKI